MNKLTYLTYQVFPSEKANSIQTIRMLENLSLKNIDVNLIYPRRGKLDFRNETINDFYNIENQFEIKQLAHKLPFNYFKNFEKINFVLSSFLWSIYSVRKVMKNVPVDQVMMTRTHWILFFLRNYKNLTIFECHKFSKINNFIFKLLKDKANLVIIFTNLSLKQSFSLSNNLEKNSIVLESSYEDRLFQNIETYSEKQKNKVVFVGQLLRFNRKRDLEFLINAFKEKSLEDFELRIIGGPNQVANDLEKIAGKNTKFLGHLSNKDAIKEMGLDIDNPAYEAVGNVVSGTTNVPLDRILANINNVRAAMDKNNAAWQRLATLMGWNRWDVGIPNREVDKVKEDIKKRKAEEKKRKREEEKRKKKKK